MLKPGIVTYDKLRSAGSGGARRHASLLLLKSIYESPVADPSAYDTVLPLVQMANGVWRDTSPERLAPLDDLLVEHLADWPAERALRVVDVAAASGITSVELYRRLARKFQVDFVASDLVRDAVAVSGHGRRWTVIFDSRGNVLQYVWPPFVLPGQGTEPPYYPLNRLLRATLRRRVLAEAQAQFAACAVDSLEEFALAERGGYRLMRIPLLARECLELDRDASASFRFEVLDLMEAPPPTAEVVRAMNIVTPHHFEETALRRAISHLLEAVEYGGLLVIGRSPSDDPAAVKASVFRRADREVEVVGELNGGSEVTSLVHEIVRSTARSQATARTRPQGAILA